MLGLSDRIRAIALLDERDARFNQARALHREGQDGLSFDQAQHMYRAQEYHQEAVELLASAHPDYRPPPWEQSPTSEGGA